MTDGKFGIRGLRPRRKTDYKTELLREIAPEGFDAASWTDDLHMVSKGGPATRPRILLRDSGWVEIDRKAGTIRTWGRIGRAQVLAQALADGTGWNVEHLEHGAAARRPGTTGPSPRKPPEDVAQSLADRWHERGYPAMVSPEGVWVDVGNTRLRDVGDYVEVHGPVTNEAITAMVAKAKEDWGGAHQLDGPWSAEERDRVWLESQRQGVHLDGVEPSASARAAWEREQADAVRRTDTLKLVRAGTRQARDLKDAASGDREALARLPVELRAFVGSYLDDEQRQELAQAGLTDIIPELPNFLSLGRGEIARIKAGAEQPDLSFKPPKGDPAANAAPETLTPFLNRPTP